MVKSIQPNNNNAVNNTPDSNDNNSDNSFQSYLNADPSTVVNSSNLQTPYQLMSSSGSPNFGAPASQDSSLEPAPENFGPPQIGNNASPLSSFGAPQPAKNNLNNATNNVKAGQNQKLSSQSSTTSSGSGKPKESYQKVRQMETNAMMQNAITHMKVKDPDPEAWQ